MRRGGDTRRGCKGRKVGVVCKPGPQWSEMAVGGWKSACLFWWPYRRYIAVSPKVREDTRLYTVVNYSHGRRPKGSVDKQ